MIVERRTAGKAHRSEERRDLLLKLSQSRARRVLRVDLAVEPFEVPSPVPPNAELLESRAEADDSGKIVHQRKLLAICVSVRKRGPARSSAEDQDMGPHIAGIPSQLFPCRRVSFPPTVEGHSFGALGPSPIVPTIRLVRRLRRSGRAPGA